MLLFIPIGYPSKEQKKAGPTGSGLHGPGQAVARLGKPNKVFDATDGCIVIADNDEMKEIAD